MREPIYHRMTAYDRSQDDSKERLPTILDSVEDIAVPFLDSSHLPDDVSAEFSLVHPRLSNPRFVIFDNTFRIAEEGDDGRVNEALHSSWIGGAATSSTCRSGWWYTPGLAVWRRSLQSIEPGRRSDF